MINENLKYLIKEVVKEILNEVFRKFDFRKLKGLQYPRNLKYVEVMLPQIGKGSSRVVYALSGKKVLKFARQEFREAFPSERGLAQNEAEVDVYSNPKTKNVVAKVFDFAPDYSWLISEAVRPIQDNEEFERLIGILPSGFERVIRKIEEYIRYGNKKSNNYLETYKEDIRNQIRYTKNEINFNQKIIEELREKLRIEVSHERKLKISNKLKIREENVHWGKQDLLKIEAQLEAIERMEKNPQTISLIDGLTALIKNSDLVAGDMNRPSQFGLTSDRRVVLLDYGYTTEVMEKYY